MPGMYDMEGWGVPQGGGLSGPLAGPAPQGGGNVFSKIMQGLAGMQQGGGRSDPGFNLDPRKLQELMGMKQQGPTGVNNDMGQLHPEFQKGMQHGVQAILKLFHHLHNMSGQTGQSNTIDNSGINLEE